MAGIKCKELVFKTLGTPESTTVFVDGKLIGYVTQVSIEVSSEELSVILCQTQTGSEDVQVQNISFDKE